MAPSDSSCAHCGKQSAKNKRCSICKEVSYCGAVCQNAAWKKHKKICVAPVSTHNVLLTLKTAYETFDWREVLKWEGRLEELLEAGTDINCDFTLCAFFSAHQMGLRSTHGSDHAMPAIRLQERRVELLGRMERFRDQGEAICSIADILLALRKMEEATTTYTRARDIGAAHGFFSVESDACLGLGQVAMQEGRHEEGVDLLRNALAAAPLNEANERCYEMNALRKLIDALFQTNAIDEIEPLVLRFREVAQVETERSGSLCSSEFRIIYIRARLHEARGRPHEAAREVRALLALIRENRATVQEMAVSFRAFMEQASVDLNVLDPETGDDELIDVWVDELTRLRGV